MTDSMDAVLQNLEVITPTLTTMKATLEKAERELCGTV